MNTTHPAKECSSTMSQGAATSSLIKAQHLKTAELHYVLAMAIVVSCPPSIKTNHSPLKDYIAKGWGIT